LLQDQERSATLGVPLKINAYPDNVDGKVYGAVHSGRVRVLGVFAPQRFLVRASISLNL
jgi:tripartite-type tricarboxylate transporter receptor subunit TctC